MNFISTNTISFLPEGIRERQAESTRLLIIWAFLVLLGSCSEKTADPPIPEVYVPKADLVLHPNEGKWYYENEPFNGYAITYHDNGGMEEKIGYYQGKKEGPAQQWFENGVMGSEMSYSANKIQGSKRTWWPNGVMSSEAYFDYGVVTGVQKSWYATGQIARLTTVKDGKPEGIQQAWLQNGKIYANFEVKNDRIYGMKRSNLCYSLSDEKITNESVENLDDSRDTDIL